MPGHRLFSLVSAVTAPCVMTVVLSAHRRGLTMKMCVLSSFVAKGANNVA